MTGHAPSSASATRPRRPALGPRVFEAQEIEPLTTGLCDFCEGELDGQKKRFCSVGCRDAYWKLMRAIGQQVAPHAIAWRKLRNRRDGRSSAAFRRMAEIVDQSLQRLKKS